MIFSDYNAPVSYTHLDVYKRQNKDMLERLVPYHGVKTVTSARVTGYADGVLTAVCGDEEKRIPCDSVILAVGCLLYTSHWGCGR